MTTIDLLNDPTSRGVLIKAEGDCLKIKAPAGTVTPELKTMLLEHKPELLKMLDHPKPGSLEHPQIVRAKKAPMVCLWDNCDGWLNPEKGRGLFLCSGCGSYFEPLPPEEPGISMEGSIEHGTTVSRFIN
jgi:hypothetical protein